MTGIRAGSRPDLGGIRGRRTRTGLCLELSLAAWLASHNLISLSVALPAPPAVATSRQLLPNTQHHHKSTHTTMPSSSSFVRPPPPLAPPLPYTPLHTRIPLPLPCYSLPAYPDPSQSHDNHERRLQLKKHEPILVDSSDEEEMSDDAAPNPPATPDHHTGSSRARLADEDEDRGAKRTRLSPSTASNSR